jgi:histidine ammonia-lyase
MSPTSLLGVVVRSPNEVREDLNEVPVFISLARVGDDMSTGPSELPVGLPMVLDTGVPPELAKRLAEADVSTVGDGISTREAPPDVLRHVTITTSDATPSDVAAVAAGARVDIADEVYDVMWASRQVVENALADDVMIYGLNTGLGPRRNERVSPELLFDYQRHIVMSHAGGVGDPLPDTDVRAILFARLVGLARGGSGASPSVLTGLAGMLNAGVHPVVPEVGSVGASDLAALAAVGEVLIGQGRARYRGREMPGREALSLAGLRPVELRPKDALAVISANAVSVGVGATTLLRAQHAARLADLAGALTLEAMNGNLSPFDAEVQAAKPFPGQRVVAANVLTLLTGSYLGWPGAAVSLQDPLSMRTIPQVHGAFRDQVDHALYAVTVEINARADNPLILPGSARALSNGNFHPMVLALAFESLRVGAAHMGITAERRVAKLAAAHQQQHSIDDQLRGGVRSLPTTIAYSAATLSSQLKQMAAPVTLMLPPLGQDIEDHGTLAPVTVLHTRHSIERLELLLTIEILMASALIATRTEPVRLGMGTWRAYDLVANLTAADAAATSAELVAALRAALMDKLIPAMAEPPGGTVGEMPLSADLEIATGDRTW